MKTFKTFSILTFFLISFSSVVIGADFNEGSNTWAKSVLSTEHTSGHLLISNDSTFPKGSYLNAGFGASNYGMPFYGSIEVQSSKENQSFTFGVARQKYVDINHSYWGGLNYSITYTIMDFFVSWNYYVNEMVDFLPDELEVYGGVQLDYEWWKVHYNVNNYQSTIANGNDGLKIGGTLGARYFIGNNDRLAINATVTSGTGISSGRLGVSYRIK